MSQPEVSEMKGYLDIVQKAQNVVFQILEHADKGNMAKGSIAINNSTGPRIILTVKTEFEAAPAPIPAPAAASKKKVIKKKAKKKVVKKSAKKKVRKKIPRK